VGSKTNSTALHAHRKNVLSLLVCIVKIDSTTTLSVSVSIVSRRTKAEQEVLSLTAPLGKLGRFDEAADFFQPNA